MTWHAYLPTPKNTDKVSVFASQVLSEVAAVTGKTLKHATTKHAQTIEVVERTHARIKTTLKVASAENQKQWQKYVPLAILNYNTCYHTSLECEPLRVFHRTVPYNILNRFWDSNLNLT